MTARYDDDRLLSAWLHETAPAREPEHLLDEVLARTARTRRRPAWSNLERWNPMSAITSRFAPPAPIPWRMLAVAAALLLALAIGLVFASGGTRTNAPPYGLAANGPVAYEVGGDIVIADTPGGTPRVLLAGATEDRLPIFALDGSRILFLRGPNEAVELWTADADGSNARRLTAASSWIPWLDWSPDGASVLLSGLGPSDGRFTILAIDAAVETTFDTGLQAVEAGQFRPTSGNQISFRGQSDDDSWGFWIANRDGSGLQQLQLDSGFADDPFYAENRPFYFNDLTWASSGSRIAFHTLEPDAESPAGPGFRIHVADVDAAGVVSNERTLEYDATSDDEYVPKFVPGTDDIVFQSIEGTTHRLFRASTLPGAGAATDLGVSAEEFILVTLAPDGRSLIAGVPNGPADADGNVTRHAVQIDLGSLQQTPLALPDDFTWQRAPIPN